MNLFDQFHSTVLFSILSCLCRACFTHLISSNLSCNLCLWYCEPLVHFNKEINANVYRLSLWEHSKRFHCSFEWHLTPHMHCLSKPVLGGHPVLSRHYSIPRGHLLNTGFTVINKNFAVVQFVGHTRRLFIVQEKIPCLRRKFIKSIT